MAFVNIQVSDELYQRYAEKDPSRPQKAMADTLKAFADEDPAAPRLVFKGDTIKELNATLEWPIDSPATLIERVKKFKQVSVPKLGLSLELSEPQLLALQSQANFWNKEGKASGEELVKFCKQQLLAGVAKVVGP